MSEGSSHRRSSCPRPFIVRIVQSDNNLRISIFYIMIGHSTGGAGGQQCFALLRRVRDGGMRYVRDGGYTSM